MPEYIVQCRNCTNYVAVYCIVDDISELPDDVDTCYGCDPISNPPPTEASSDPTTELRQEIKLLKERITMLENINKKDH